MNQNCCNQNSWKQKRPEVRLDLKMGYWSQCGQYFQVKPNPSPEELSGEVGGVLDWGSKGC